MTNGQKVARNYILDKTSIDSKTFNKKKSTEWYITCEEAVTLGMVDGIIKDIDEIL